MFYSKSSKTLFFLSSFFSEFSILKSKNQQAIETICVAVNYGKKF